MSKPHIGDFTITSQSVTVIVSGEPITTRRTSANFEPLSAACLALGGARAANDTQAISAAEVAICKALDIASAVSNWNEGTWFEVQGDQITYQREPVDPTLTKRILDLVAQGQNPMGIARFWLRLMANPSPRSTGQLYAFMQHIGIPIICVDDPRYDGCFLAYKGVTSEYLDCHTETINNRPGQEPSMLRSGISDDPDRPCHRGLHVGALEYARGFGERVVIVMVDPKDVVCIPYDSSHQKMRVCKYRVVGYWNGNNLPSTYATREDLPFLFEEAPGIERDKPFVSEATAPTHEPQAEKEPPEKDPMPEPAKAPVSPLKADWQEWDLLGYDDLMKISIMDLRKYATYSVKVIRASKIPGGKNALVHKILETRRR